MIFIILLLFMQAYGHHDGIIKTHWISGLRYNNIISDRILLFQNKIKNYCLHNIRNMRL